MINHMDLKEEIKSILRQRCDELGLEYFDSEELIINKLTNHVKANDQQAAELEQLKREIEMRKSINQTSAASTQTVQK